jgi:phage shock protein E
MATGTLRLRAIGYLLLALLGTGCAQEPAPPTDEAGRVDAAELSRRISTRTAPVILDVREADEFAAGHLPGAVNIPHGEIVAAPEAAVAAILPDTGTEVVVYCASGRRSGLAQDALIAAGYGNVRHLAGDYQGWRAADLPIAQDR